MSITIPGYIQVNDAAGNTVAFLSPEADKIKECWMDRRLNEESTLTFHIPATSKKLSELDPESRIIAGDREFVILKPDATDTVRDDAGQTWTKVMAVESWKLLGKTYPTINNDPDYPWPPDRKGDAYNDPDHGWIIPDALVVCIVSGGDNLSGGLYQTGTAAHALYALLKGTGWTLGTVDVTGTYDLETEKESTLTNIQEVQKIWGGMLVWEYVFDDNDKIVERKLHLRNEDTWRNYTGFQIRYAKNLKHITRTDNNDIVTRLYAFGENDLDIYAINDGKKYVENYSYTDSILFGVFKDQKIHDQQELKEKAEKALAKMCKPRRTYRIKMADLRTLPEYQHEDFQLGDIVDVIDEDLSINLQARIVRHRHNVFMPWQCELEVGEPEERLVSSLKSSFDIAKYVKETVRPNKGISQIVKGVLDTFHTAIQGAGGDFEVSDGVATWWETDDEGERTGNLVRITPKGMLISDDGGQTSQLAITGEGIAAEAIVGTLGMFAKVRADQIVIGDDGEKIPSELLDTSYIDTQVDELDIAMSNLGNTITNAFSDSYITNIEAQSLNLARNSVVKEATDVKTIATSLQVSTTALTTAINTLNTEVNKYVGKSSYPIAVTAANRTALNNAFTALEAAIVALYAAIDQKQIAEVMDYVDIQKKDLDESIGELDDIIATAFSDNVITNIEAQSLKTAMWSILQEAGDVFSIADALGIDTDDVEETADVLYALLTENYIDQEEYPIEVSTINREAILSAFADLETAIVALYESIDQKRISNVSSSLTNYIDGIGTTLTGLIDGKIDTWFYEGTPTLTNNPAKDWTTNTIKDKHLDDLYYNTANGYVYRFVYESNAYKWVRIKDTDIVAAMQIASAAQDTADSKRRIFVTQPVPPYDIGDLWRVTNVSGVDFKICTATRLVGNYDANDWANVDKTKDYIDTQKQELDGAIGDLDDTISTAFSDGVITNIEAQGLKIARDSVVKEATDVKTIATSLQVSTTALTTAINTLNTEVNKYVGKSSYPIAVTAANRTALNNAFTALEAAIVALYAAIDQKQIAEVMDYVDIQKKDLDESIGELDDIIATAFSDNVITNIEAQSLKTAMWSILQEAGDVFSIADALGIDTDDVEETADVLYALLTENYIDQEEYPIEVSTINREAILSAFADLETAIVALYESIDQKRISNVSSSLTNYIDGIGTTLTGLIDGKIDTWFYEGTPTLTNNPAKDWTTNTIKDKHLDDLYYNTANGYVYRFVYESNAYKWVRIKDTDIVAAMQIASAAQDTADSKRRIFVTQPVPPYDIGDLWRVTNVSGVDFKICTATRLVGNYDANDWANVDKTKDYIDTQKQELDGAIGDLDDTISTAFSDNVITNIEAQSLKTAMWSILQEAGDVFSIADALGIDTDDVEETADVLYALLTENYIDQEEYPIEVSTINREAILSAFADLETAIVALYESIDIKRASDIDSTLRDDLQLASPLPGYVKLGSEGVRVYDAQNNIRGIFGSWLADAIRKYGIKIIDGEIYSTTFQTGAEDADTYIRLDPDGNFSAYKNGKRIIFMQASASEGRIRLGDGIDNPYKMLLAANHTAGSYLMSLLKGENGLDLSGGVGDFRLLPDGSMQAYLGSGKEFYIQGNHWVTGTKNAAVTTDSYGQRLLYSYEMPESKFMDEGVAELVNGACRVNIDPIFLETIEPNTAETPFIVHLTPYDWLNLRVDEIGNSYFIVEEKDGLSGKFSWQLSATRKGYAGERMRRVDDGGELLTSNWEDELLEHAKQEG